MEADIGWIGWCGIGLGSLLISRTVARSLATHALALGLIDSPNERSSHSIPTPRGGGLGIIVSLVVTAVVTAVAGQPTPGAWLVLPVALIAAIGWADDVSGGLSTSLRFVLQLSLAGGTVIFLGPFTHLPFPAPLDLPLGLLALPLTVVWIVGVTNVFNFLDGIDGYAGTQGLIAGVGLIFLGGSTLSLLGLSLAAASLGFLTVNWSPARIFMGDVGALAIGFFVACAPLLSPAEVRGSSGFTVGLLLWFFLADGFWTFARRLLRGAPVWKAHREHLYQRLHQMGWSHSRVVSTLAGPMTLVAASGILAFRSGESNATWLALGFAGLLFALYYALVRRIEGHRGHLNVEQRE